MCACTCTCTLQSFTLCMYDYIIVLLFVHTVSADAYVTISPSTDHTTFENNPSTFTFSCSGNGSFLFWMIDGLDTGTPYVLSKGIVPIMPRISLDRLTISSQLIVPTTKANNNITVICVLLDLSLYNHQSSDPVRLILQGTVLSHLCM